MYSRSPGDTRAAAGSAAGRAGAGARRPRPAAARTPTAPATPTRHGVRETLRDPLTGAREPGAPWTRAAASRRSRSRRARSRARPLAERTNVPGGVVVLAPAIAAEGALRRLDGRRRAGQEAPGRRRAVALGVGAQRVDGVDLGIDRDRDHPHAVLLGAEVRQELRHPGAHHRADRRAGREDEVDEDRLVGRRAPRAASSCAPALVDEREVGELGLRRPAAAPSAPSAAAAICATCASCPVCSWAARAGAPGRRRTRPAPAPASASSLLLPCSVAGPRRIRRRVGVTGIPLTLNSPIVTVTVFPAFTNARRVREEHEVGPSRLGVVRAAQRAGRRRARHRRSRSRSPRRAAPAASRASKSGCALFASRMR